jgi:hypothetical protein
MKSKDRLLSPVKQGEIFNPDASFVMTSNKATS